MAEENVLKGVEGAKIIVNRAGLDFMYSSLLDIEKSIIEESKNHLLVMKESGYLTTDVEVASVYNKDKRKFPAIVVECSAKNATNQGLGQNKHTVVYDDGVRREEFMVKSANFELTATLNCVSLTRDSVSKIADALMVGFKSDLSVKLASLGINIMFNKISYPGNVKRTEIVKDQALWEIPITIPNIVIYWMQFYAVDGSILKDISYYSNLITLSIV